MSDPRDPRHTTRRHVLHVAASTTGILAVGCVSTSAATSNRDGSSAPSGKAAHDEAEVTPAEDLMQEHGILERILLIYDEVARRIDGDRGVDTAIVGEAAGIVRRFVEDYHEKLEEQFIFPRLEKARREVELVAVLRRQHDRGREVTDDIVRFVATGSKGNATLATQLRAIERMYRPHAAREDTVVFPAFRDVVGRAAYQELGEQFENEEHARFGEHGFENTVAIIARLENALGIADLAQFTPS